MIEFDMTVTWRHPDGSTVDLPATVCYRDGYDAPERRAEAVGQAIEANIIDFPDDITEGALPMSVRFADV